MSLLQRLRHLVPSRRMGIQAQLLAVAIAAAAALVAVFVVESLLLNSVLREVERGEVQDRVLRTQLFLHRNADAKMTLMGEFAYWDDTWDFIDDPGSAKSRSFIKTNFTDWLPHQYGVRAIQLWNRERTSVFQWTETADRKGLEAFNFPGFLDQLDRREAIGGFVRDGDRLVLVAGAVVLHSGDTDLSGPRNGYLGVALPVGSDLLQQASLELQQVVSIVPDSVRWGPDSIATTTLANGDSLEVCFVISGLNGKPAGMVKLRWSRSFLARLQDQSLGTFAATAVIGMAVLLLLLRSGSRLLILPLNRIARELNGMQVAGRLEPLREETQSRDWGLFVSSFNGTIDALRQSERKYQILFDQAADAMFLLDADGETVLDANPAAEWLTGMLKQEMQGKPLADCVQLEAVAEGRLDTFKLRRAGGRQLTVSVASSRVEIGSAARKLLAIRDLTERETLEAQLRNAQKMEAVGLLAGGVAHDFNNLLGAVMMAASALREELPAATESARESLATMEHASRRAAELTRELLSFARPDRRASIPLTLNDVVANVTRLCLRTFDRAIHLETNLAENLPAVLGDPGQLEQALLNLCINARDAMPDGGVLRLETRRRDLSEEEARKIQGARPGAHVSLLISDTGPGLTPEVRQHLFEPFFTTKGQGKGTGLGLPVVYGIVRGHDGVIFAHPAPERGTVFEVLLPVSAVPVQTEAPALSSPRPPRGQERVLIIDDEAALRSTVGRSLKRLGYEVVEAENGRIGVDRFANDPDGFAIILLDVIMPEMGGAEAFGHIRALRPGVPILVCSGYATEGEHLALLEQGADGFLRKPFDVFELASAVRAVLDGRRLVATA